MIKPVLKGLAVSSLMVSCLINVAQADTTVCTKDSLKACDITLTSLVSPTLFCGVTTPLRFTLTNSLPVSVPYTYSLTDNNGNYIGAVTRDPASTCSTTSLAPGSCTLILDLAPACPPEGNLNYTLKIVPQTTQPPLSSVINSPVITQPPIPPTPAQILLTAANCAVLGGTTITNAPGVLVNQFVNGNVCLYPGTSLTGIDSTSTTGTLHVADAVALQAQADLTAAVGFLNSQTPASTDPALSATTLTAASAMQVYNFSSSADIASGTLNLSCGAYPGCLFIFQIPTTLTAATGTSVTFAAGASAANTYWVVGSSATLLGTSFAGNILAADSISFSTPGTPFAGRALASTGADTFEDNVVTVP